MTITDIVSSPQGSGQATGSGIVLDSSGDILTNAHVIAGGRQIQVTFSDGRTVNATVVGFGLTTRVQKTTTTATIAMAAINRSVFLSAGSTPRL